jgi:hypothetical protein
MLIRILFNIIQLAINEKGKNKSFVKSIFYLEYL